MENAKNSNEEGKKKGGRKPLKNKIVRKHFAIREDDLKKAGGWDKLFNKFYKMLGIDPDKL